MSTPNNLFIALEGIDGSGKSTQARLLAARLEKAGHKVYTTFEPTKGRIGSILRNILTGQEAADERTIAGLFVADRLDHLLDPLDGIMKKLEEGYTVICDRYYFSSYAYHSVHMDMDWVIEANRLSAEIRRPDLNLFIDVTPEVSMARITANREGTELYETDENLRNVREQYQIAMERLKDVEKIVVVDGSQDQAAVAEAVWETVSGLIA